MFDCVCFSPVVICAVNSPPEAFVHSNQQLKS